MTPARLSQVQARPFGRRENALSARGPSGMCWAAASVRYRADSVAKLGKRRLTRNNRIGAKDLLNLEGSVRSSGMTPAAPRGPRPHRSRIERSRARWGTMGIVAEACWCSTLGLGWGVRAEGGLFARGAGT